MDVSPWRNDCYRTLTFPPYTTRINRQPVRKSVCRHWTTGSTGLSPEGKETNAVSPMETQQNLAVSPSWGRSYTEKKPKQKSAWSPLETLDEYQSAHPEGDTEQKHAKNSNCWRKNNSWAAVSQNIPRGHTGQGIIRVPNNQSVESKCLFIYIGHSLEIPEGSSISKPRG